MRRIGFSGEFELDGEFADAFEDAHRLRASRRRRGVEHHRFDDHVFILMLEEKNVGSSSRTRCCRIGPRTSSRMNGLADLAADVVEEQDVDRCLSWPRIRSSEVALRRSRTSGSRTRSG
ncbi:MAG: hypothetical protein MZU97_09485 [Bacillus subtilis]|nr:hypothetical protein [Bacillus subtilis]